LQINKQIQSLIKYFKHIKNDIINEITLYAAALSFYTIFSLVPILLIILSFIASSPLFSEIYDKLENFISSNILPTNKEIISNYLKNFLNNSSQMGVIGGIYIILTSILFFNNFEEIVSKIFNQPKRNIWERIKLYWTMITLFPILFGVAMYLSIKFQFFLDKSTLTSWIQFGKILPFFLIWATFFLSYKIVLINEKTKSTLITSLFVTIAFFIAKNTFIYYVPVSYTHL
jgi:membrane protein